MALRFPDVVRNISVKAFQHNFEIDNFSFQDLYNNKCVESGIKCINSEPEVLLTLLLRKAPKENITVYTTTDIFEVLLQASIKKGSLCIVGTKFELEENSYFEDIGSSKETDDRALSKMLSSTESESFVYVANSITQYQLKESFCKIIPIWGNERHYTKPTVDATRRKLLVTVSGTIMIPTLQSDTVTAISELLRETSLENELAPLFQQQDYSDIEICVNGKNFSAHKGILHARSKGFAELLQNTETNGNIISINDFSEDVVREALRFIYTGKSECVKNMECELLRFAEKFQILGLKCLCELEIISSIDISNACEFVDVADRLNALNLKSFCIDFIKGNMKSIVGTDKWKKFNKTNPDLASDIVEYFFVDQK